MLKKPWWSKVDAAASGVDAIADPTIDALAPEGRAVLAAVWQERAASELKVAGGFAAVTGELIAHGADHAVLELASRAVRDEVHHAEIAVDMAARYRGDATTWPPPSSYPVPTLAGAEGRLRATLLVVAMCCINETLACGVLEGQLSLTSSPLIRAAIQSVLADEIDHARIGWAHITSSFMTPAIKADVAAWLPRLLDARLREIFDSDAPFPGQDYPDHGILPRAPRKKVIATALETIVFPGLARAGIDVAKGQEWARSVAR